MVSKMGPKNSSKTSPEKGSPRKEEIEIEIEIEIDIDIEIEFS